MNIITRTTIIGLLIIIASTMVGCTSTPAVHSIYDQGTDFSQYKTYGFLDSLEPKDQQYSTIVAKYLKQAIVVELEKRGMTASEQPDALIGFNIHKAEKIKAYNTPAMGQSRYYGYRSMHGYAYGANFATETHISQYTEGTLNIDVVDRARKQLVWEGVAIGRLNKQPPDNLQEYVQTIVTSVFMEYPVQ